MKGKSTHTLALLIKFLLTFSVFSQETPDSLYTVLKQKLHDTDRVKTLNALGAYYDGMNPDTAFILYNQALSLSQKANWQKGQSRSLRYIGGIYIDKGDYPKALQFYTAAFNMAENYFNAARNDAEKRSAKKEIAQSLGNLGLVYFEQSDYPLSLDYYFKALNIAEELKDEKGKSNWYTNIGLVYMEQSKFDKALEYYFKALDIAEKLGLKKSVANTLGNIGIVYDEKHDYKKALEYYSRALQMDEAMGNKNGVARDLGNIGIVYQNQFNYSKALDYHLKALEIDQELGNQRGIARHFANIGAIYIQTGKFTEAENYLKRSLNLSDTLGILYYTENDEFHLYKLYDTLAELSAKGKLQISKGSQKTEAAYVRLALEHYKNYMGVRDSLRSDENQRKQVRAEMNYEFETKRIIAKAEHEKELLQKEAEKKRQGLLLWLIAAIALAIGIIAALVFRSLKIVKKQNVVIELQKKIVEEKNKNIMDSIHYAQRIQKSLLPTEKYIEKHLKK
jgi:tetratricopeptide (TPR) repeat protein